MAQTIPASGASLPKQGTPVSSDVQGPKQTYYECGAGRKTFFCFAFILLLPFYISLPVMLFQRLSKGLWVDTWQLMALAALFTILMVLIVFEMIFSLRAEVEVGEKSLVFTLPSGGGGTIPSIFYETRDILYQDIDSIETRCEILGGRYAPMMMRTVRIIMKNGETIVLGRTNERDDDPKFPFPVIAEQVARRIGSDVVDCGNVTLSVHRRMLGMEAKPECEPEAERNELNKKHNTFLTVLSTLLFTLLVLGIIGDFVQENADSGERARSAIVTQ